MTKRSRDLRLSQPADYVRVTRLTDTSRGILAERGAPCIADVGERPACLKRLQDALSAEPAFCSADAACPQIHFLVEARGEVVSTTAKEEIVALLAPIDSAEEAWLLLQIAHRVPGSMCGDVATSGYRPVPEGFELSYSYASKSCDGHNPEMSEVIVEVTRAGSMRTISNRVTHPQEVPCP